MPKPQACVVTIEFTRGNQRHVASFTFKSLTMEYVPEYRELRLPQNECYAGQFFKVPTNKAKLVLEGELAMKKKRKKR